jgi:HPt (histidine-containing phosphotransfer) domain-containing protein
MATASITCQSDLSRFQAPIDLVRLAANTLGNRELEVQVLRLFVTQSSSALCRLDGEDDTGVLKDLVHTLKGSARAVGADAVAHCCEDLEEAYGSGDGANLTDLHKAVEEANAYIGDLLSA